MSDHPFSPLWYRVSGLKPRLRAHVDLCRRIYRGRIWYLLVDRSSGRSHRFNRSAYRIIGRLDGRTTVQEVWEAVSGRFEENAPTQDAVIQLLAELHEADLLHSEVAQDAGECLRRNRMHRSSALHDFFRNPLSQKIPLWDPDDFLEKLLPRIDGLFHRWAVLVWIALVGSAAVVSAIHRPELSAYAVERSFSAYNLIALCAMYPAIKFLHELGHAVATKRGGGEVHEIGMMFLIFMPIPYVDSSAVSAFPSKTARMLVSGAGILVELWIAAFGFWLWLNIETGLVRDLAFNAMLIGGVSSLLFNGNPLMRFDGYYLLSDAIGVPNLYRRSNRYLAYLCQRYLFGVTDLASPASSAGEAYWLFGYCLASFIYRIAVLWVIVVLVTEKFFVIGAGLGVWIVISQIVLPIAGFMRFIGTSPRLRKQRNRAVLVSGGLVVLIILSINLLPVPASTTAEGVLQVPEDGQIRAETDGIIEALIAEPDQEVGPGTPLINVDAPFLTARVVILEHRLEEAEARYASKQFSRPVQAEMIREEIKALSAEIDRAREKHRSAVVRSAKRGRLLISDPEDLPGRYVKQGELLGYVIDGSRPTARVLVSQQDIAQVRRRTEGIEIRYASHIDRIFPARILREVPEAGSKLPSPALSTAGGGLMTPDPDDPESLAVTERFFQFDLEIVAPSGLAPIGTRVFVRFDHGREPLAGRMMRGIRQLFLKQFDV